MWFCLYQRWTRCDFVLTKDTTTLRVKWPCYPGYWLQSTSLSSSLPCLVISYINSKRSPGGVLPMWWVIHMCRGFDPLFSLWQDRARSFWGTFSHPPTAKLSFGVQKLPIFTKIDLFGRKFNFFLDLFGSNFQRPAAHPHQFSGRVPPPGKRSLQEAIKLRDPSILQLSRTLYASPQRTPRLCCIWSHYYKKDQL